MLHYPPARISPPTNPGQGQWSGRGKWKIVLHTTETTGLPSYQGGQYAPHLTYHPQSRQWFQHYYFNRPAEAVGTYDNDQLIQIEIICYSSRVIAAMSPYRLYVGNLPDTAYADIAEFGRWFAARYPFEFRWPGRSAPNLGPTLKPGFRFAEPDIFDYSGFLGHQHLLHNTARYDPGAFDWLKLMGNLTQPLPPEDDDMAIDKFLLVKRITDAQIDQLFLAGTIGPDTPAARNYYKLPAPQGIRNVPSSPDWDNVVEAMTVAAWVEASS